MACTGLMLTTLSTITAGLVRRGRICYKMCSRLCMWRYQVDTLRCFLLTMYLRVALWLMHSILQHIYQYSVHSSWLDVSLSEHPTPKVR
ncbi:hypothetical protein BJX65DRAFT_160617 [Aspergillus insuetus]